MKKSTEIITERISKVFECQKQEIERAFTEWESRQKQDIYELPEFKVSFRQEILKETQEWLEELEWKANPIENSKCLYEIRPE